MPDLWKPRTGQSIALRYRGRIIRRRELGWLCLRMTARGLRALANKIDRRVPYWDFWPDPGHSQQ